MPHLILKALLELPIIKPSENCIWPKGWKQRTTVMGIINITPDSFSDGGRFLTSGMVVREAASQLKQGADVITDLPPEAK